MMYDYRDHNYRELVRVIGKPYRNDDDDDDICGYDMADWIIPHIGDVIDDVNDDAKSKVNGSDSLENISCRIDKNRKNELVQLQQQQHQQQHQRNNDNNSE